MFADKFRMEYEYSCATRLVRITRSEDNDFMNPPWNDGLMISLSSEVFVGDEANMPHMPLGGENAVSQSGMFDFIHCLLPLHVP
jgi:hypothetical protein